MLNKEQMAAASDISGTSIIVAGAGTGKTQTLIHKLVNLTTNKDHPVDPARICLLTFTNDAADTMKQRAMKLGAANIERLTACTYHSFCDRLMRKYNHLIGQPNDYQILEPSMVRDIVGMKLNEYKKDLRNMGIRTPTSKTIASLFSTCINKDMPLRDAMEEDDRIMKACNYKKECADFMYQVLCLVRENVEEYKIQKKLKDYDDLLLGADKLLDDKVVRDMINLIYEHILIDEYQDTNHLQAEIVHKLRDSNPNLVVVGDDYQSIYKFRGAEVKNFTDFPTEFQNVKEYALVQNYRSTQEILDLSNRVMAEHAKFGFKKTLVSGTDKHGRRPYLYQVKDQRAEGKLVYKLIKEYKAKDPDKKVAVLYRGSGSSVYLEGYLHEDDISYEKHGGTAFFDMEYVQDVLSYLRVIADPFHALAWYRIFKVYTHIGDKRAADMSAQSNTIGFLKTLKQRTGNTKTAREIDDDISSLECVIESLMEEEKPYEMMKIVVSHYKDMYKKREEKNESMRENEAAVFESLDILAELSNNDEYTTLQKWLDATALRELDKPEEDTGIILSTIHSAKGLEWDHVILLDCADGVFPKDDEDDGMEEELRCFYVAMTRAIDTLDIVYPKCANVFGKQQSVKLTPFLKAEKTHLIFKEIDVK